MSRLNKEETIIIGVTRNSYLGFLSYETYGICLGSLPLHLCACSTDNCWLFCFITFSGKARLLFSTLHVPKNNIC